MAGSLVAPPVRADENSFYNEVAQKVSPSIPQSQALFLGRVACNTIRDAINAGLSLGQARAKADAAVGWAQDSENMGLNQAQGMFLVEAAEHQQARFPAGCWLIWVQNPSRNGQFSVPGMINTGRYRDEIAGSYFLAMMRFAPKKGVH